MDDNEKNPFRKETTQHRDFEIMKDLRWHCSKCELESGQARTWKTWKDQKGIQFDCDEGGKCDARIECKKCGKKTVHRKLKTLELSEHTKIRSGIGQKLAKRVKDVYGCKESVLLRKLFCRELEIDHKFPFERWRSDEDKNNPDMSESEIRNKFIVLNRSNNQLKREICKKCYKTGKRGSFPGIYYWYKGGEYWDKKMDKYDERGCEGCFWYDPYEWREKINKLVKK